MTSRFAATLVFTCVLVGAAVARADDPDAGVAPDAATDAGTATGIDAGNLADEGGPVLDLPDEDPAAGDGKTTTDPAPKGSNQRTSLFGNLASKAGAIVNRTVIGGYGEAPFVVPEHGDSYFEARRLVFFFYAPMHPRISFSTELEFEQGGTPTKSEGRLTEGEVILEFAAVDFKVWDILNLRAGIILVPFGKFNINHDSPTRDLTDRPLVIRTIIPSTWFESGAGIFGKHQSGALDFNYEVYAVNGLDSRIFDGLGNRGARGSLTEDNNDDKAIVGRVGTGYFGKLGKRTVQGELGASYYDGAYNRAGARARLIGGDLTFRLGPFEFLGEVVRQFNQPGFDDDWPDSSRKPIPEDLWGFYVQANLHFFPGFLRRAMPADLKESTFTASLLYEVVDTDMSVTNENDRNRFVVGLNYRPIEPFVWKHELQRNDSAVSDPSYDYVTSVAWLF